MMLDDIETYLTANGIGAVHKDILPSTPDTVVTVYGTGGLPPMHTMNGPRVLEQPRIQVVCRSASLQTAHEMASTVYELLDNLKNETINGVLYHYVQAIQNPFLFNRDQNARFAVACNYDVKKDRST